MGGLLKDAYGVWVPQKISESITRVYPSFPSDTFLALISKEYLSLELMARAHLIARTLGVCLPSSFTKSSEILIESLGPPLATTHSFGISAFFYLPHTLYVSLFGLEFWDASMRAQYEMTQRFSAEFSIRPFLERYESKTVKQLSRWALDPNVHVRRLVSEGTRPRLPWASRLRSFQEDPAKVVMLLEILKDDPERYVQRSVANNLNDIGKDNPTVLTTVTRRWLVKAPPARQWIINRALRSMLARGDGAALSIVGVSSSWKPKVENLRMTPKKISLGKELEISFRVTNTSSQSQRVVADICVHFLKAHGRTSPKRFIATRATVRRNGSLEIRKKLLLINRSTRKLFLGKHRVEVVLNGAPFPLGSFTLKGKSAK